MGVRHVVVFRFREGTTADQRATIVAELRKLPAVIPEIASYTVGEDAGLVEGTWDFAVIADFASEADYLSYRENPDHRAVIARHIQPVVDERGSAQIVVP